MSDLYNQSVNVSIDKARPIIMLVEALKQKTRTKKEDVALKSYHNSNNTFIDSTSDRYYLISARRQAQ